MPRRFSEPNIFHKLSNTSDLPSRQTVRPSASRQSSTSRSPASRTRKLDIFDHPFDGSYEGTGSNRSQQPSRRRPSIEHERPLDILDDRIPRTRAKQRRQASQSGRIDRGEEIYLSSDAVKLEAWSPTASPRAPLVQAYASLPGTPVADLTHSPFMAIEHAQLPRRGDSETTYVDEIHKRREPHTLFKEREPPPFSLWEYLREELLATDFDSHQELKWERVSNFINVPLYVEKVISFGMILCFDTFLHTFTILPIRFILAVYRVIVSTIFRSSPPLPPSQKADILRMMLLLISIAILLPLTDASKIYHSIRGQDTIKLYVIFNALEIGDRLLTSIGQDVLDCMFSRSTLLLLSNHIAPTTNTIRPFVFFVLSVLYTVSHALVLVYQLTALNVAINAYDYSLLTLLLSNQFVEIKGSVFKKFEKDNLFQITCADIVERFQLSLILVSIAIRNLIELSSSELDLYGESSFVMPVAFKGIRFISGRNIIGPILSPVLTVLMSELVVDWLKHAFITKFNHIRPTVYERYIDVLCRDLTTSSWVGRRKGARKHNYVDQSPVVARRLGLAALPLAVLSVLIGAQSLSLVISTHFSFIETPTISSIVRDLSSGAIWSEVDIMRSVKWIGLGILTWLCMITLKLILGINLLAYATRRRAGMEKRRKEDEDINEFHRPPIGEGREEQSYNKELKTLLMQPRDDAPPVAEIGENSKVATDKPKPSSSANGAGGGRKKVALEDLTRFTMVKRIW